VTDAEIIARLRRASPRFESWWRSTTDASPDSDPPAIADALTDLAIVIDQLLTLDKRRELPVLLAVVEEAYAGGTAQQRALVRRHVLEALAESCALSGASSRPLEERLGPECRAAWADVVRA
jgi:hypothetical protein